MQTKLFTITDMQQDADILAQAAQLLREGALVAIPTETVYGLAANALDPKAAAAIYAAKGRPSDNPLIVHVHDVEQARALVRCMPDVLPELAKAFWPGPLTVVLPKSKAVPDETSGGLDTVAIRVPAHPVARELIRLAGVPLAAPSANLSGSPSPTCAQHCMDDLSGRVDAIVDGGACGVGLESTVLTLCTDPPAILRPGAVTLEQLQAYLPNVVYDAAVFAPLSEGRRVSSPGMKYRHYAPKTPVALVRGTLEQFAAFVADKPHSGVLCFAGEERRFAQPCVVYGAQDDGISQARALFAALRKADKMDVDKIYIRISDSGGIGQAVKNRLLRAAGFEEICL